jgi:hypothetical protein
MVVKVITTIAFLLVILAAPARAQEVTLSDLEGATIQSRVFRAQTVLRGDKEFSGRVQSDVDIVIGPGDNAQAKQTVTWLSSNGTTRTTVLAGSGRIGKPRPNKYAGGGDGVAVFSNETLTYMRTFRKGAFMFTFKFTRTSKGLACTSAETFLKEQGATAIRSNSVHDNHPITVLSDKQLSSTCLVVKR